MFTFSSTDSMTVKMTGAPATTNPNFAASTFDATIAGGVTAEAMNEAALNGATPVTVVSSPAAGTYRHLVGLYLVNLDTAQVTIQILVNGNQICAVTLAVGDIFQWEKGGNGFSVLSSSGAVKSTNAVLWGGITGTLSAQSDLNTALNGKQPLATNLTSIGALANAVGWLHNDGSGVFVYSTPAAASWPVSGTPAIVSTLGALANATGHLFNNGTGTLSWVAEYTLPTATPSVLGGVKPDGTSILNTAGVISATAASVGALASGGTAVLATAIAAGTANQIPYQTGPGATSFFSASNYGVHIYGATGVPASIAGAAGVLVGSASAIPAFSTAPTGLTVNGLTISTTTGTLTLVNGSTLQTTGAFTLNLTTTASSTPTFPTGSGTLAYLAGTNTWTGGQTFNTVAATFALTDVHTLGHVLTASASVSTAGYLGYNSTQLSHEFFANGLKQMNVGTMFTQTATGTNGANTAITNILGTGVGTAVLPASWTLTGKSIRIRCSGTVTTAATPGTTVITLRLNAGTPVTVVATPSLTLTASMTSMPFEIEFLLVCRSTTSVMASGRMIVSSSTTGVTGLSVPIGTITAATVVAATSYTLEIDATNGTASGTIYTTQTASIEVLN